MWTVFLCSALLTLSSSTGAHWAHHHPPSKPDSPQPPPCLLPEEAGRRQGRAGGAGGCGCLCPLTFNRLISDVPQCTLSTHDTHLTSHAAAWIRSYFHLHLPKNQIFFKQHTFGSPVCLFWKSSKNPFTAMTVFQKSVLAILKKMHV